MTPPLETPTYEGDVDRLKRCASRATGARLSCKGGQEISMKPTPPVLWFKAGSALRAPSPWWYWGRAVYVSRRDYGRIFLVFVAMGVPLGGAGVLLGSATLLRLAVGLAVLGGALLAYSLLGLYRMYGHPSLRTYRRLFRQAGLRDGMRIADLHIGTYRTTFALASLHPTAHVTSVDCWDVDGPPAEPAVADVRALEPPPTFHSRIRPVRATALTLPLSDGAVDAVVLGFGTHEIPAGARRERLFREAARVLRPGGVVAMFEHGKDLHNFLIFGPVIDHVTRREEWMTMLERHFTGVRYGRSSTAVDLMTARHV
jgi:SAM-dependent methyltransferase